MTTKPYHVNPNLVGLSILSVLGAISVGTLAFESKQPTPQYEVRVAPVDAGVQSLHLTSDTSGVAAIKLDEFLIYVSFDFEAHPDSYGVPGSDITAIDITNLAIDKITDVDGKSYSDFTDYNDHRNINLLLAGFIEKNKLVEV